MRPSLVCNWFLLGGLFVILVFVLWFLWLVACLLMVSGVCLVVFVVVCRGFVVACGFCGFCGFCACLIFVVAWSFDRGFGVCLSVCVCLVVWFMGFGVCLVFWSWVWCLLGGFLVVLLVSLLVSVFTSWFASDFGGLLGGLVVKLT